MNDNMIFDNRKARFNYTLSDTYEAGIVLTGTEIKSIRINSCNLTDSYVSIRNGIPEICNMFIQQLQNAGPFNHEERRNRKLLLNKNEIRKLVSATTQKGYTIVPTKAYYVKGRVKIEIALAKGKNLRDKRETIKKRDIERDIRKDIR